MALNSLDIAAVVIVFLSVVISALRGGVREVFSLVAIVAGFVFASNFYLAASDVFFRLTSHQEINDAISFLAIFLFTAVLISFIGGRITDLLKKSRLSLMNTLAGTAIGALKGVLVCAFVVYVLLVFMSPKSPLFSKSVSFPYIVRVTELIESIAPAQFRDAFDENLEQFRDYVRGKDEKSG